MTSTILPGATSRPAVSTAAAGVAVLRAIAYADLFDWPLTDREVHRYLVSVAASPEAVRAVLDSLVPDWVGRCGDLYFLAGREDLVRLRRLRVERASRLWPAARDLAHAVAALPFVRMVAVTGSLARDNVDGAADVDLLIVTEPGRLWVCRALVGVLARRASKRGLVLCANYYLAESALALPERDLYTAVELAQMVPVRGLDVYERLRRANPWADAVLPNAPGRPAGARDAETRARRRAREGGGTVARSGNAGGADTSLAGRSRWLGLVESALRSPLGGVLDRLERRRKRRQAMAAGLDLSEACFELDRFKGHFDGHAGRIAAAYERRLRSLGLDPGPVPALDVRAGSRATEPPLPRTGAPEAARP